MRPVSIAVGAGERRLTDEPIPIDLDNLVPGETPWEVEIGFGKGRYLLRRALEERSARFLGLEVAAKYYRLARDRMRRKGLSNLVLLNGEALFTMSVALPRGFASAVHVYFPDPWPKARHHRRRLFDVETIDLVIGLLHPGGRLFVATDHLEYGAVVRDVLIRHRGLRVIEHGEWSDGARTNYEAKYMREGRPVTRLEVIRVEERNDALVHPDGRSGVVAGVAARAD